MSASRTLRPTSHVRLAVQPRQDGSYPSGHSAIEWAWALIRAEIVPDRQNAILARERSFRESRVICNVHWLSDTEAGAMMDSAIFARPQAEPQFHAGIHAADFTLKRLQAWVRMKTL